MLSHSKCLRYGFCAWISCAAVCVGCGDPADEPVSRSFLIVVESSLYAPLQARLAQYAEAIEAEGFDVRVEPWLPGTVDDLKTLLFEYVDLDDIEGALLIGDLPAAWYEQVAFDWFESFPTDLYLQNRDAVWTDEDGNGVFDTHSDLVVDIYTSRLNGTPAQLQDYFARVAYYHRVGPLVDVSGFIFIDDDWSHANTEGAFDLARLYSRVEIVKEKTDSTLDVYLAKLTGDGTEFTYQWMHSAPAFLSIRHINESNQTTYGILRNIAQYNFKGSFFNLFNCSAARFTDPHPTVAQDYVVGSDYGLAIIGSTKTGAVNSPHVFHESLVLGKRWGEAYEQWFNEVGKRSDQWNLGIVLMGDPLLRLTGDLHPSGAREAAAWMPPGVVDEEIMKRIAETARLDTFEKYRANHPEFFVE
ncbi:MAG: hypothetical protein OEV36_13430 [Myxococcales bacterium]|nr:hypothetical protein [Myxococcales bacterium]